MPVVKWILRTGLLTIFLALLQVFYPWLHQYTVPAGLPANDPRPLVIAHRGASGTAPENTLAAFRQALDRQADMIELDVHLSRDGHPVVIHDFGLERTTGHPGRVNDLTFVQLRELDAGSWFAPGFAGEKIPALEEVLRLINGRARCVIELKGNREGYYPGLAERVAAAIEAAGATSWCVVQSFDSRYLEELHRHNPELQLVKIFIGVWSGLVPFYYDTGWRWGSYEPPPYICGVNLYYRTLTRSQVEDWHRQGLQVWSYTLNDTTAIGRQARLDVDGIITDFPASARQALAGQFLLPSR